jgi:hypothetical protein
MQFLASSETPTLQILDMPLMSAARILHLAKPVQDPVVCVESAVDNVELRKFLSCISLHNSVECLFIIAIASDRRK